MGKRLNLLTDGSLWNTSSAVRPFRSLICSTTRDPTFKNSYISANLHMFILNVVPDFLYARAIIKWLIIVIVHNVNTVILFLNV